MRLLLLFSALLAALTGVTGNRVAAQPIQASAAAAIAAPRVAVVSAVSARFALLPYGAVPPLRVAMPRLVSAVTARILYADRRRE